MLNCIKDQKELFQSLADYKKAWEQSVKNPTLAKFRRSLPKAMQSNLPSDFIEAVYENRQSYLNKPDRTLGDQESRTGKRLLDPEKNLATPEQQIAIKKQGIKYFQKADVITDAEAEYYLATASDTEKAVEAFLNDENAPADTRILLGSKLLKILAQKTDDKSLALSVEVADKLMELATKAGRALRSFQYLGQLTPEGILYWANRNKTRWEKYLDEKYRKRVDAVIKVSDRVKNEVRDEMLKPSPNQYTLFGFTRDQLKSKKEEALKQFKKTVLSGLRSGLDPAVVAATAKLGFYEFLDGAATLGEWMKRMGKHTSDEELLKQVWGSEKVVAGFTLEELEKNGHLKAIKAALGTNKLEKVLKDLGRTDAAKTASDLNNAFNTRVSRKLSDNRKKAALRGVTAGKAISALIKNPAMTKEEIVEALKKEAGIKALGPEDIKKVQEFAKQIAALPEGVLRDQKAAELAAWMHKNFAPSIPMDIGFALWYAAILSGPATHVTNIMSNFFNTFTEVVVGSIYDTVTGDPKAAAKMISGMRDGYKRGVREFKAIMRGAPIDKKSSKFYSESEIEKYSIKEGVDKIKAVRGWKDLLPALTGLGNIYAGSMKYVPRFMAATDAYFYHGLYGGEIARQAWIEANKRHPKDSKLRQEAYNEIMGFENGKGNFENRKDNYEQAYAQAAGEAASYKQQTGQEVPEIDVKRRAFEIIEKTLEGKAPEITWAADRVAARGTFNYEPEGVLGWASRAANFAARTGPAFRFIVPFTNIVANVLNQQLDYTPLGAIRGARKVVFGDESYAKTNDEAGKLIIKSLLGTTFAMTLLMAALSDDDDERPWITGRGPDPKTPDGRAKLYQLRANGWIPYSFRVGDTRISYQYTPLAAVLAIVGNVADRLKYDKFETDTEDEIKAKEEKIATMTWKAMSQLPSAFLEMSFLKGLTEFVGAASDDKSLGGWLERFGSRLPTSFVPNAINAVDRAFDGTIYETKEYKDKLINGIPIARHSLKPSVNVWGEPVERYLPDWGKVGSFRWAELLGSARFVSQEEYSDKATEFLADRNIFVPPIGNTTKIGKTVLRDDPELYYNYSLVVGREFKRQMLNQVGQWQSLTKEQAAKAVESLHTAVRDDVKRDFLQGKELNAILMERGLEPVSY